MNPPPAPRRPGLLGRPVLTVTLLLGVLAGIGAGGVAIAQRGTSGGPRWQDPAPAASSAAPRTERAVGTTSGRAAFTLSATGDVIMANAPGGLPPRDGAGFFDSVTSALASDLAMGNLEQPLTDDTGVSKCGSPARPGCHAFRSPPSYARHLREGGYQLLNTANNHSRDYGPAGFRSTVRALEAAGLRYTGVADQITVVEVRGVKVAVLGFSPYAGANSLLDLDHARAVVRAARRQADVVVVQAHMGGEGAGMGHVKPGDEIFLGENRGDAIAFTHAVVDAGADLVIGHGPHVLRGMQFYKGRLIAYSLGNFAGGGHTLSKDGVLKYAGVLRVSLTADGRWAGGRFLSTYLDAAGLPTRDSAHERGRALVAQLSAADFGDTAARIGADGTISPPA
jgi:Bacterial capsule synthesis protein PGA_cap